MDCFQMGRVREEPQGEVLLHYCSRAEAARQGNRGLEAYVVDDRTLPWL